MALGTRVLGALVCLLSVVTLTDRCLPAGNHVCSPRARGGLARNRSDGPESLLARSWALPCHGPAEQLGGLVRRRQEQVGGGRPCSLPVTHIQASSDQPASRAPSHVLASLPWPSVRSRLPVSSSAFCPVIMSYKFSAYSGRAVSGTILHVFSRHLVRLSVL